MHRVVIFEDLAVMRDLLVETFGADSRYQIVGAFDDGAVGLAKAITLAPDVAIVDYVLPGLNGLDVAKRLVAAVRSVRVILLTAHDRPEVLLEAIDAGLPGVVTKGAPLKILKEAVEQVLAGARYRCPTTTKVVREARGRTRDPLTVREREVMQLIASGLSTKQVAHRLGLSEKTVTNHRTNLMRKLDVHDLASLTREAIERGLVPTRGSR